MVDFLSEHILVLLGEIFVHSDKQNTIRLPNEKDD